MAPKMRIALAGFWLCAVGPWVLAACAPEKKQHPVFHANATRHHLKDGRYAMQAPDGMWYWWYISTISINNSSKSVYNYGVGSTMTPPSGGTWVRGPAPSKIETEEEEEEPVDAVETNGEITNVADEADFQAAEPVEGAGEPTTESPSAEGSGSTDSGASSGGDSGGGGVD